MISLPSLFFRTEQCFSSHLFLTQTQKYTGLDAQALKFKLSNWNGCGPCTGQIHCCKGCKCIGSSIAKEGQPTGEEIEFMARTLTSGTARLVMTVGQWCINDGWWMDDGWWISMNGPPLFPLTWSRLALPNYGRICYSHKQVKPRKK